VTDVVPEYDTWSSLWWQRRGPFASLRWIARARAEHVPPAPRADSLLLDLACGGGLLHPYIADKGYRHVGVDVSTRSAEVATRHGVDEVIISDIQDVPLADGVADVVIAGHCLEHVERPLGVVAECCRLLRPGGTLIIDTIADTFLAKLATITLGEHIPVSWAAPKGTHDHRQFISPAVLVRACETNGVPVETFGLMPDVRDLVAFAMGRDYGRGRDGDVHMRHVRSTRILYGVIGVKPGTAR
jgi:2-polyprenyl-6-hydroxyphenyl methylase / 3-demethylubiquinone-9 3-methyltransferase